MIKILMIFFTFSLTLFGMSYAKLKKHTLKHAKVLKSQQLSLQVAQQKNHILLRTTNPTLTLEASRFNDTLNNSDFGYSINTSQTIRTESYFNGLKEKTYASTLLNKAFVTQGKARYIKTLEEVYTDYVYQNKMLKLLKEEYKLSKEVTSIVKERYKNGSDTKVSYLQAKTETLTLKTQMYTTKQQQDKLYYQLLVIAGFSKKVKLEKKFIYSVSPKVKHTSKPSPQQKVLQAKEKLYQSDLTMSMSGVQSYDLYAGMEKEPDQSILRVGISIPLLVHNDRSEERVLARLQGQQAKLDSEQLSLNLHSQKKMLRASIRELSMQYHTLKALQKEQHTLFLLLQEGYQIAQGSLFQLMHVKNRLIQTRKSLIQTDKIINNQKIQLYFLQGDYNE